MPTKWNLSVLALLVAGAARAAGPSALDLAPAGTALVIGVNIEGIKASKLGQSLAPQLREQTKQVGAMFGAPAMDMLDGIREVVIVATKQGLQGGEKKAGAGRAGARTALALASGRFTAAGLAGIAKASGASQAQVLGVTVYTRKEKDQDPVSVALLNDSLLAIGDPASVRACLARRGQPGAVEPGLRAKAGELAANYHIWIATSASLVGDLASQNPGEASGQQAQMLQGVRQISGGLKFGPVFQLDLNLDTKSPQDAASLRDMLNMLIAMGASSGGNQFSPVLQNLKLNVEENSVKLALAVSEEDMMKSMPAAATARKPAAPPSGEVVVESTAPKPAESQEPEASGSGIVVLPAPARK